MNNILLGCTGSGASRHLPKLVNLLQQKHDVRIKVIHTQNAKHFFNPASLEHVDVYTDADQWTTSWTKLGDPILHIELRDWADIFLIAPLDANTLAKIATGLCDNLLTTTVRAWDAVEKRLYFAPAMNAQMWNHPLTVKHVNDLQRFGYRYIPTREKMQMCGKVGVGGMATLETIIANVMNTHTSKL